MRTCMLGWDMLRSEFGLGLAEIHSVDFYSSRIKSIVSRGRIWQPKKTGKGFRKDFL